MWFTTVGWSLEDLRAYIALVSNLSSLAQLEANSHMANIAIVKKILAGLTF